MTYHDAQGNEIEDLEMDKMRETGPQECRFCGRPYLRVTRGSKVRVLVTHRFGCPITDKEDRANKARAKEVK